MDRERGIDDLYARPPEEFVGARNELVRTLRAEGAGGAAEAVKSLRRPSHAASIVNRLAREEPELIEALLGAGGELRQAHRQAAAGRGGTRLRDAAEAERQAVDRLMARARAIESRPVLLERVRETLHAAASDDGVRAAVAAGRVTDDARAATLGPLRGGAPAKPAPAKPSRAAVERRRGVEAQLRRVRAEERRLRKLTEEAARSLEKAETRHARTRAAADEAVKAADEAAQAVADQRERLERAVAAQHEAASFIARLESEADAEAG